MILCFELSIPSTSSSNGRWSGEDRLHAKIVNLGKTKKAKEKGELIIKNSPYLYSWHDEWRAGISVKEVDAVEANRIRKCSAGFLCYDWMIDSIRCHGEIRSDW